MVTWVTWVTWVMVYDCFTHITNYSLYLPFHSSSIEFHSSILVTSAFLGLNGKTLPNWNWPWTPTSKKMQEVYPTGAPIRTTDIDLAQMGIERLLLFESGKFSVKTSASIVLYWLEWSKSLLFPKKIQVSCTENTSILWTNWPVVGDFYGHFYPQTDHTENPSRSGLICRVRGLLSGVRLRRGFWRVPGRFRVGRNGGGVSVSPFLWFLIISSLIISNMSIVPGWWFQPLWKMSMGRMTSHILWKIMFETTNQVLISMLIFINIIVAAANR